MIAPVGCVIPALDAGHTLEAVTAGLRRALRGVVIIAVDDGSRDDTCAIAARCCDLVIAFDVNRGKGVALQAGIAAALAGGARAILTIDADGQHDPRYAPLLIRALDDADVAVGTRAREAGAMPWRRRVTNRLAGAAVGRIIGSRIADAQCGYRALRRDVVERVHAAGERYEYEMDFLIQAALAGFRIASVPVPTLYGAPSHFRDLRDSARVVRTIWRYRAGVPG